MGNLFLIEKFFCFYLVVEKISVGNHWVVGRRQELEVLEEDKKIIPRFWSMMRR